MVSQQIFLAIVSFVGAVATDSSDSPVEKVIKMLEDLLKKFEDEMAANDVEKADREQEVQMKNSDKDRRVEKIEHNLTHFGNPRAPAQYPRFSDKDVPFWQYDEAGTLKEPAKASQIPRHMSEPHLKITEVPWESKKYEPFPEGGTIRVPAGISSLTQPLNPAETEPASRVGSHTMMRWSTDCLDHGHLQRNKPRFFESIRPPHIGPRDLEELDVTSSMEPIRSAALKKQAEDACWMIW